MSFFKSRITQWSYSRLTTWETCPLKARFKFVDKIKTPGSPAANRGLELHKQSAEYLTNPEMEFPIALHNVRSVLDKLRTPTVKAELQIAVTKEWTPTAWFAPDVYCRVIYDVLDVSGGEAYVGDLKSGKIREEEHEDQLSLYAAAVLSTEQGVEEVTAAVFYSDHPLKKDVNPLSKTYKISELKGLRKSWDDRAGKMLADDIFAPKANPTCRYCDYSKKRGGACPVN